MDNKTAREIIGKFEPGDKIDSIERLQALLCAMKSLDSAVPVVRGHWIKNIFESEKHSEPIYYCSNCENFESWGETEKYNYCPNCGARMDEKMDEVTGDE